MLLNLVKLQQPDISKNHLYVTVTLESKYQLFIDGREKVGIKNLKIQKRLLIIHKQLMMFMMMKIWKTITQQRKGEC